jgi:hypothetical protein
MYTRSNPVLGLSVPLKKTAVIEFYTSIHLSFALERNKYTQSIVIVNTIVLLYVHDPIIIG